MSTQIEAQPNPTSTLETLRSVDRTYRSNLLAFLGIMLPAVVFGYIAIFASNEQVAALLRQMPRGAERVQDPRWPLLASIRFAGFYVSWLIYSFAFGAVSQYVRAILNGTRISIESAFNVVREKLLPWLGLSTVLFAITMIGFLLVLFASGTVYLEFAISLKKLGRFGFYVVSAIPLLLLGAFLSRWTLAIPALLSENLSPFAALKRSDELTDLRILPLLTLIIEGFLGSFLANIAPHYLLS